MQSYPGLEVIVIDNSLDRNFNQYIAGNYPFTRLYSNPDNLSYSESLNKGIYLSKGGFVLCLNDDVTLEKDYIKQALKGFVLNPRIGMVSGKILRQDGKTLDSVGLSLSFYRTAREKGYGLKDKGQFERGGYIFGVTGAAAFYRKEMLGDIKEGRDYFDSNFRFFYKDLDIAWRAARAGWKGYYVPQAVARLLKLKKIV